MMAEVLAFVGFLGDEIEAGVIAVFAGTVRKPAGMVPIHVITIPHFSRIPAFSQICKNIFMGILKCFDCGFPTMGRYKPLPGSEHTIALCKLCKKKLTPAASHNPLLQILDEERRSRRKSDRPPGRPIEWTETTSKDALVLLKMGLGIADIARKLGFSYTTTLKRVRRIRERNHL